jgi:hypothetical protein
MIGKVYGIPPQPADDNHTTYVDAGPLSIGVEYRVVDQAALRETYKDDPAHLAELERESPAGGFSAQGLSLHVVSTADRHEYLRFDLFDDPPHYHYIHPVNSQGEHRNHVVEYDAVANGPMLDWALERLRTRLPEMLTSAGAPASVTSIDRAELADLLDRVARTARTAGTEGTAGTAGTAAGSA